MTLSIIYFTTFGNRLHYSLAARLADAVVLTGDIAIATNVLERIDEMERAIGAPVWFVLGNHDYYKGSIADVRARAARTPRWLHASDVVKLDATTALVGVDGWGDARLGDFANTRVMLNDFFLSEACWHDGELSNDDWLPFFTCKATGDVLRATFAAHPAIRATVLCGHTHSSGQSDVLPNLRVLTGGAEYGAPRVQQIIHV